MILRLVIADGSQSPAVAESVEVAADGALTGWRSVSDGGAGWFDGRLPPAELAEIQALIEAVGATPPKAAARPDSAEEVLELDATGPVSIAGLTAGPGDWSKLAAAARGLLDRLTDFPRAVVGVRYAPGVARLVHRGADPVRVDVGTVTVGATAWRGYYEPAGDWAGAVAGPGEIEAGPEWTYDLPLGLSFDSDTVVHLTADFTILNGPTRIPVRAKFTPDAPS
ncbi:hypothetical protein BJ973_004541 [Actinoplanes tereljensis]|uniref:Uncharacterized protein n=1 Tax=Paractinoplanes tereljensis TaxID=571912 RepID=A0A919TUQ1_9ACTN|nr:hypothetical protein [Actinoplanes tereljensis]GIF23928.1 hypothetical protein Ate02nite_66580 [Actinoplanes tereljensis]